MRQFVYFDSFALGESGLHNDFLDGYRLFRKPAESSSTAAPGTVTMSRKGLTVL